MFTVVIGLKASEAKPAPPAQVQEDADSSSDDEAFLNGYVSVASKKRKRGEPAGPEPEKKQKLEKENILGPSGFVRPKEPPKAPKKTEAAREEKKPVAAEPEAQVDYEEVNLDGIGNVEVLVSLGLQHLKHALTGRCHC